MSTPDDHPESGPSRTQENPDVDLSEIEATIDTGVAERHKEMNEDADTILDEIDEVLEEHAEEFVRRYVRKGGQGWSMFLDPAFFVGAAAAGVAAAATWDTFKLAMTKFINALRQTGGLPEAMVDKDGSLTRETELQMWYAWKRASEVRSPNEPTHDIDEATAVHWLAFLSELHRAAGLVKLGSEHYRKITAAAENANVPVPTFHLVAQIIDEWLRRNPNADRGIYSF